MRLGKVPPIRFTKEVEGARGNFMLQGETDSCEIKTVARWDSLDHRKKFWHGNMHKQMQSMHKLRERKSVEIYREVDGLYQVNSLASWIL